MIDEYPKKRYGNWAGNTKGTPYDPERCAEEVGGRSWIFSQCSKKNGHGLRGLFCATHAHKHPGADAQTTTIYRTRGRYGDDIEAVVATKVTAKSVWVGGRRSARVSEFERYHDTREEAVASQLQYLRAKKKRMESDLIDVSAAITRLEAYEVVE